MEARQTTFANRYKLGEQLGEGGMGIVYKAFDRLMNQEVALKQVLTPLKQLKFNSWAAGDDLPLLLTQEFSVLSGLHHPHIVQVLDYGFDAERRPYFTMELLPDARNIVHATHGATITQKVHYLIQLLQALTYLHRQNICHRDLKPSNVLVSNGQVKLVDFGLAIEASRGKSLVGTLPYLAPEVLRGGLITPASDLYAVGLIAYEMIAGHYPFDISDSSRFIEAVMHQEVDLLPLVTPIKSAQAEAYYVGQDLQDIDLLVQMTARLLNKDPYHRPARAEIVISQCYQALGEPVPPETEAIRESFLSAARFVGRRDELHRVLVSLKSLFKRDPLNGAEDVSRAWLVGGESGVGKSRLLDEVHRRALVQGCIVLQGQALPDMVTAYQLWRDPIRRLALAVPLTELEAGVLLSIDPTLPQLLERPVMEVIPLTGIAAHHRFLLTVIDIFRKNPEPTLLVLEDLQWVRDGLDVLNQLVELTAEVPLMIIASYRDDENASLPAQLPQMTPIKLDRLSLDDVAELSASMLGGVGRSDHIVDLLNRETEGNPFFIVEVIQTLALEAGSLRDVGIITLPQQIFAGGVEQVVRWRLNRVNPKIRPLLLRAAAYGRYLDLRVFALLTRVGDSMWLSECAEAAVLQFSDGQWRFAHDKIREALMGDLTATERAGLHREIAQAIETVYPYDPTHAAMLAEQWRMAGDIQREKHFLLIAAEYAWKMNAYRDVLAFGKRWLHLAHEGDHQAEQYILTLIGHCYYGLAEYKNAVSYYENALRMAQASGDVAAQAHVFLGLARVAWSQGEWQSVYRYGRRSLEIAQQIQHLALAVDTLYVLASHASLTQSDLQEEKGYIEECFTLAKKLDDPMRIAYAMNGLGNVMLKMNNLQQAYFYYEESHIIALGIGDRRLQCIILYNLARVSLYEGDLAAAKLHSEHSIALAKQISDRYHLVEGLLRLSQYYLSQNKPATALPYLLEMLRVAWTIGSSSQILRIIACFAWHNLLTAEVQEGILYLGLAMHHPATGADAYQEIRRLVYPLFAERLLPQILDAGLELGRTLRPDTIVETLLNESQQPATMGI